VAGSASLEQRRFSVVVRRVHVSAESPDEQFDVRQGAPASCNSQDIILIDDAVRRSRFWIASEPVWLSYSLVISPARAVKYVFWYGETHPGTSAKPGLENFEKSGFARHFVGENVLQDEL
jgi:hypothetical protein